MANLRTDFEDGELFLAEYINETNRAVNDGISTAAQAAEDASGYLADLQEAIADLPDGQAVTAEVADHAVRVADLEANSATKEEVTSKYGDYSDISEFLSITTDADDKILEGFKKDGTKVFTGDVDAPNIRQLDTGVTQAKSQAQNATAAAQQASTDAQAATTTAQQASAAAQSAAEQTQQLSQEVVEKYGDYEDVSEFLEVKTDAEDRFLEGIKKDGTKVFSGDVDAPNIREQQETIEQMQDSLEWFESMLSQEWAEVTLDDENHVIKGVKKDGTAYFYKLESPTLEAKVKELVTDMVGNIGKDIKLEPSAFIPSEILGKDFDLEIPNFDDVELEEIDITSQSDFETAMTTTLSSANKHVLLNLQTDVDMKSNPQIAQGNTLVINGNGHMIKGCNKTYPSNAQDVVIKGTNRYCPYAPDNGGLCGTNTFVAPNGDVIRLARSRFYTAASRIIAADTIYDANGDVVFQEGDNFPRTHLSFSEYKVGSTTYHMNSQCVYHCKFQLPDQLADLEISEEDNVYINLTTDWTSVQTKVLKAEDGWLYFDYISGEVSYDQHSNLTDNSLGIDNDWHISKIYTSFYLINYKMEDNHSCLIKDIDNVRTLIFPAIYKSLSETYMPLFTLAHTNVRLKIHDATLIGFQIVNTYDSGANTAHDIVVIDKCLIKGCVKTAVYIQRRGSEGYLTDSEAYDCDFSVFSSSVYHSVIVAKGNYLHDIGTRRNNSYGVAGYGEKVYIGYNKIVNFGYGAVRSGIWNQTNPAYELDGNDEITAFTTQGTFYPANSIIEHNLIYQTPEYFQEAHHHASMDAGAIYNGVHNTEAIIRHNIVYNYTGRGFNRGIYLDGGSHHIYVYSNVIANTPKSWAINAYFAQDTPYYGLPYTLDNTYKYICNNYVENGIKLGGRTAYPTDTYPSPEGAYYRDENDYPNGPNWHGQSLDDNHCFLGHNIINNLMLTTESDITGIKDECKEEQYIISMPSYQGAFNTSLDITGWLNKL